MRQDLEHDLGVGYVGQHGEIPFQAAGHLSTLPFLQTPRGLLALESLSWLTGQPLHWRLDVVNEALPAERPPVLLAEVQDHCHVRAPLNQLSSSRLGYHGVWTEPRARSDGAQIIPIEKLAALREAAPAGSPDAAVGLQLFLAAAELAWRPLSYPCPHCPVITYI